jgi:magnesium-transporting ATPase (P-type)
MPSRDVIQDKLPWHAMKPVDVAQALKADENGLSAAEAAVRLERYGANRLPMAPPPSLGAVLLHQFRSPLIYILGIAAAVSLLLGEFADAGFIAAVLLVNALIGGSQEWRAEKSSRALQKLLRIRATVVRDGEPVEIDGEAVVPGDVVWLESGNRVPADVRLSWSHGLEADESLLTGESLPVLKDATRTVEPSTPVADRVTMAHAGSMVTRGRGRGFAVDTGARTVVGLLAVDMLTVHGGKPPLLERLERFARAVAVGVLAAAVVVGFVGVVARGYGLGDMFLFAVALAVSAIPEGLPVALTVALAIASTRMARRGVIVRRLAAVEGLGSCTLIGSDKTGTLTCNELTVRELWLPGGKRFTVTGEGFIPEGEVRGAEGVLSVRERELLAPLMRAAVLCNEADLHRRDGAWAWRGDPTDVALLAAALKLGWTRQALLARHPQENQIPFEPERKYAASYHRIDGRIRALVKGAPERVLAMCVLDDPSTHRATAEAMAARGLRVLAFAEGPTPEEISSSETPQEPTGLTFLGFAGMIDPLRSGVVEAVQRCYDAGITVCMITGDHPVTALAIARDLGLAARPDQVVSAAELEGVSTEELRELVRTVRVFARVTPRQKLEIVEAARAAGHFVAVTGDGVNDAPALRAANIGVAMGRGGTDVAREAAELVITDDNFATIVAGVEEGRIAYDNIRKVVYLLVSTGAAEVVMVILAVAAGLPLPLLPAQILWLNLVTNGIQDVALAFEPGEGDALRRKPRAPRERVFDRLMIERTVLAAAVMGGVAFGAFAWMTGTGWTEGSARNAVLLLMVLFENVHVGNSRSETKSVFRLSPLRNPVLLVGTLAAFLLHLAMMHLPIGQALLRTEPVSASTWLVMVPLALTILVAMEFHKWLWARWRDPGRAKNRMGD